MLHFFHNENNDVSRLVSHFHFADLFQTFGYRLLAYSTKPVFVEITADATEKPIVSHQSANHEVGPPVDLLWQLGNVPT